MTLTQPGTGKSMVLTQDQADRVELELKRTASYQSTPQPLMPGIAADLVLTLEKTGSKREFILYGRSILRDAKTQRERQFYMGLLLAEWMM